MILSAWSYNLGAEAVTIAMDSYRVTHTRMHTHTPAAVIILVLTHIILYYCYGRQARDRIGMSLLLCAYVYTALV